LHSSGLNFNDNTLPSSKLRDGVTSSGIAIDNITWDTAYNTVAVDILRNYGVGTIIHSDTVWSGAPVIDQNVHVMGGVTLTVQAGTEVSFESGKGVILMPGSRLNVPGSKNQPVVFQSTDSTSNPWQGILVKGPGALLNFRHVIIRDADKAIRVKKRFELTLENITFINNQYALDVRNENKEALIQFAKCKFRESKIDILNTNNKKVQLAISHCIFENSKLSSFNNHLQLINNTFIGTSQISSRQDILILKNNIFYGMTEHLNIGSPPEIYEIQYNCFSSLAN
ncbi:MAG: hypothetical protein GWN62_33710, partial [Aliifodinibius sp.]|nr:hypothetical protein [Fodinibius sp.]